MRIFTRVLNIISDRFNWRREEFAIKEYYTVFVIFLRRLQIGITYEKMIMNLFPALCMMVQLE